MLAYYVRNLFNRSDLLFPSQKGDTEITSHASESAISFQNETKALSQIIPLSNVQCHSREHISLLIIHRSKLNEWALNAYLSWSSSNKLTGSHKKKKLKV